MHMSKIDIAEAQAIEMDAPPSRLTVALGFILLSVAIPVLFARLMAEILLKDLRRIVRVSEIFGEEYLNAKRDAGR